MIKILEVYVGQSLWSTYAYKGDEIRRFSTSRTWYICSQTNLQKQQNTLAYKHQTYICIKYLQYASVATVFPDHSKMIKLLTLFSILWVLTVTTVSCENYDYSLDIKPPESPSEPCSNYRNLTFADRNVKSNKQFYLRYGHTFPSGLGFAGDIWFACWVANCTMHIFRLFVDFCC